MRLNPVYLLLLMLPMAYAAPELTLGTNAASHTYEIGISKEHSVTMTNTGDTDLYNITIENTIPQGFTFPTVNHLKPGEQVEYNYSAEITQLGTFDANVIFSFLTKSTGPATPATHHINLTETSMVHNLPSQIRTYDFLMFTNTHTVAHTLKDSNNLTYAVDPAATQQIVFITQNNHSVVDQFSLAGLTIETTSNIVDTFTHDAAKDKAYQITYTSTYAQGDYSVNALTDNFTINYNGSDTGVLQITADDHDLYDVQLEADWFTFDSNTFNINEGQTKFIPFTITPRITSNAETNFTYTKLINITATNAQPTYVPIDIHVPYSDVIIQLEICEDGSAFWQGRLEYCTQFPNSVECAGPEPIIRYINTTVTETEPCQLNGTVQNLEDMYLELKEIRGNQDRRINDDTLDINTIMKECIQVAMPIIKNTSADAKAAKFASQDIQGEIDTIKAKTAGKSWLTWTTGIFITLALIVIGIFNARRKQRQETGE